MRLWLIPLVLLPTLNGTTHACSPALGPANHALQIPYAVFEARVADLRDPDSRDPRSGQLGNVVVIRSFHGPFRPGDLVPIEIGSVRTGCDNEVGIGPAIMMVIPVGTRPPYYPGGDDRVGFVFRALAASKGRMAVRDTKTLVHRAQLEKETGCEARRAGSYAQLSCGRAYEGRDARVKVIFERVKGAWLEVLRYQAPDQSGSTTS